MMCLNCHRKGHTKQGADEKQFAENAKKITTQVIKLINAQINLSVQAMEKDIWPEATTVKLK